MTSLVLELFWRFRLQDCFCLVSSRSIALHWGHSSSSQQTKFRWLTSRQTSCSTCSVRYSSSSDYSKGSCRCTGGSSGPSVSPSSSWSVCSVYLSLASNSAASHCKKMRNPTSWYRTNCLTDALKCHLPAPNWKLYCLAASYSCLYLANGCRSYQIRLKLGGRWAWISVTIFIFHCLYSPQTVRARNDIFQILSGLASRSVSGCSPQETLKLSWDSISKNTHAAVCSSSFLG